MYKQDVKSVDVKLDVKLDSKPCSKQNKKIIYHLPDTIIEEYDDYASMETPERKKRRKANAIENAIKRLNKQFEDSKYYKDKQIRLHQYIGKCQEDMQQQKAKEDEEAKEYNPMYLVSKEGKEFLLSKEFISKSDFLKELATDKEDRKHPIKFSSRAIETAIEGDFHYCFNVMKEVLMLAEYLGNIYIHYEACRYMSEIILKTTNSNTKMRNVMKQLSNLSCAILSNCHELPGYAKDIARKLSGNIIVVNHEYQKDMYKRYENGKCMEYISICSSEDDRKDPCSEHINGIYPNYIAVMHDSNTTNVINFNTLSNDMLLQFIKINGGVVEFIVNPSDELQFASDESYFLDYHKYHNYL